MNISRDAEKILDKIQHPFMVKTPQSGYRENVPQHYKHCSSTVQQNVYKNDT